MSGPKSASHFRRAKKLPNYCILIKMKSIISFILHFASIINPLEKMRAMEVESHTIECMCKANNKISILHISCPLSTSCWQTHWVWLLPFVLKGAELSELIVYVFGPIWWIAIDDWNCFFFKIDAAKWSLKHCILSYFSKLVI